MSDIKQTWRLIVKKTGEVIVKATDLDEIKEKSLELIGSGDDMKYHIQYFEDDLFQDAEDLTVYF